MANLFEPEFDESSEQPGFSWRRAKLAHQSGGERLGASLFALPPGEAIYPLHYHLGNEELLIVIEGSPSLRTAGGERVLERGEVVAFPRGEEGAHQVVNRSEEEARVLMVSEMNSPEVVDPTRVGQARAPSARPPGDRGEGMSQGLPRARRGSVLGGRGPAPGGALTVERIGVVGAGTMGSGIAQLACLGGYETLIQDPDPEALEAGGERVVESLGEGRQARDVERRGGRGGRAAAACRSTTSPTSRAATW